MCEESNTKPDEVDIFFVVVERDINKNEGKKIRRETEERKSKRGEKNTRTKSD